MLVGPYEVYQLMGWSDVQLARGFMSAHTFALRSLFVTHSGKQSLDAGDTEGPDDGDEDDDCKPLR